MFRLSMLPLGLLLFLCIGCAEEPTRRSNLGTVNVAVDESFQPVIEAEIASFVKAYPKVTINSAFVSEQEAIKRLFQDSARAIVIPRPLTKAEEDNFQATQNRRAVSTLIAADGIVVVVNEANTDTNLTMTQLRGLLKGEIARWRDLNGKKPGNSANDSITVVLDQNNSSLFRHLKDSVLAGGELGKRVFASKSNPDVIKYVSENKNAIGFIGFNWVSNLEDPRVKEAYAKINLVGLTDKTDPKPNDFKRLDDVYIIANIRDGRYPLSRRIYIVNGDFNNSPGTGFTHYLIGSDGQLIFFRANLVPKRLPTRNLEIQETDAKEFMNTGKVK